SVHSLFFFFFTDTAPPELYTLSLHDALPISPRRALWAPDRAPPRPTSTGHTRAPAGPWSGGGFRRIEWVCEWSTGSSPMPWCSRSEEHTSELQSRGHLVCRLLLEKKKRKTNK